MAGVRENRSPEGRMMALADADGVADEILGLLRPWCLRCEIAGSVRRRRPSVRDIQVVAVQHVWRGMATDLFGRVGDKEPARLLWDLLDALEKEGRLRQTKRGPLYRQVLYRGEKADIFTTAPQNFGWTMLLRTGSRDYSAGAVRRLREVGCRSEGCRIYRDRDGSVLETPEEADAFRILEVPPLAPSRRVAWL